ncbi:Anaphase-promoting complex subunit 11 [Forsythia ovata]|uniref:Anaphase-promoting complex subunit 11 n=1 Tax=Forsythia ovata TaxID=205694 RepID=A0ABD1TMF1_9LAMI
MKVKILRIHHPSTHIAYKLLLIMRCDLITWLNLVLISNFSMGLLPYRDSYDLGANSWLLGRENERFYIGICCDTVSLFIRWHAVASWTWDAQDETCGICRMAFDGCCPDCKLPRDDCPIIWGACSHAFHLHCILKWVNSQSPQAHCPMCRREWQFKG